MEHRPMDEANQKKKNKCRNAIFIALAAVFILAGLLWYFYAGKAISGTPTLTIDVPQKVQLSNKEPFSLDLSISQLGEARYPAASFSIAFDPSHLEFMGVEEGNVFVHDQVNLAEGTQKLPEWSYNVEKANESGIINLMYLDLTGGRCAFSQDLLQKEDNVVLRLVFRLRGSARAGDVYALAMEDAVFAASDSEQSLATTQRTLRVRDGKIVVGE